MARVELPAIPAAGRELEDYVAGLFQAAGYFVERGIHERAGTDVLELDAVATRYDTPMPTSVLVEAKGGRWGFPDLFKVVGWMQYLGISKGGFFVREASSKDLASEVHRKMAPLGVSLVDLADFRNPVQRFTAAGFGTIRDPRMTGIWRYSFWIERNLLERLRARRREAPEAKAPAAVLAYHDLIHDHVFFIKDEGERLRCLYQAYRDHPKLSLSLAGELGRGARAKQSATLAEALVEGKHPVLQASLYIEHRARVSILKATIDLLCRGGEPPRRMDGLPATFRDGLRVLRTRPSFRRYALLWQVFLWSFGGFYLADRADKEFGWLSEQTGIPRAEIGSGLAAFDDLFPLVDQSWIVPLRNTSIMVAKMVPMPFRGIGALQRLRRYGVQTYDELGYTDYTVRDFTRWHCSTVDLLSQQRAVSG
jgi:hypothetical protein